MTDREYFFWIATFSAVDGHIADPVAKVESLLSGVQRDQPRVSIAGYELYRDIGRVDLEVDAGGEAVRDWEYCLVAELDVQTDMKGLLSDPPGVFLSRSWTSNIHVLSSEITTRPKGAGTAVPRSMYGRGLMPQHFTVAIEYIYIPADHWADYKTFMHDAFGPVGHWLVTHGYSHKIIVTERVDSFFHDSSMPTWNRIHILTGDFDSKEGGFIERTADAARTLLGSDHTIATAMEPIRHYRRKPKMSKNEVLYSCWPGYDGEVRKHALTTGNGTGHGIGRGRK